MAKYRKKRDANRIRKHINRLLFFLEFSELTAVFMLLVVSGSRRFNSYETLLLFQSLLPKITQPAT